MAVAEVWKTDDEVVRYFGGWFESDCCKLA